MSDDRRAWAEAWVQEIVSPFAAEMAENWDNPAKALYAFTLHRKCLVEEVLRLREMWDV